MRAAASRAMAELSFATHQVNYQQQEYCRPLHQSTLSEAARLSITKQTVFLDKILFLKISGLPNVLYKAHVGEAMQTWTSKSANVRLERRESSWASMREDLLVRVLARLPAREVCGAIRLVCWHWNSVSYSSTLWRQLSRFSRRRGSEFMTDDELVSIQMTNDLSKLQELDLSNQTRISDRGLKAAIVFSPGLTRLSVSCCVAISDGSVIAISRLANLTYLDVSYCVNVTDRGVKLLTSGDLSLTCLSVGACHLLTDVSLEHIAARFSRLGSLAMFLLPRVSDRGLEALTRTGSQIQHLDVSGCATITDTGLFFLASFKLKTLKLSGCSRISDGGLHLVLKLNPELRSLEAERCPKLTGSAFIHVGSRNQCLERLTILKCGKLKPHAIVIIAKRLLALKSLSITISQVTIDVFRQLSSHFERIRCFTLSFSPDVSQCQLLELLSSAVSCSHLDLSGLRQPLDAQLVHLILRNCSASKVSMRNVTFVGEDLSDTSTGQSWNRNIRMLNLRGSANFGSIDAVSQKCVSMECLDVSYCEWVTDEVIELICQMKQLNTLNISGCRKVHLVSAVFKMSHHLPKLTSVVARGNLLSNHVVTRCQTQLNQLQSQIKLVL